MKILYLLSHDIFSNDGITKKIITQMQTWQLFGNDVKVFNILVKKNIQEGDLFHNIKVIYRHNVINGNKILFKSIREFEPDLIYFRFEPYKPFLKKILSKYPTIFELNTNDLTEQRLEARNDIKKILRYIYNLYTRNIILNEANGFVGVSHEICKLKQFTKFNKEMIVIPNTIKLSDYPILKKMNQKRKPVLLFMGKPGFVWQGISKIIKLAKLTEGYLEFRIVGYDTPRSFLPANIKFYGYLESQEYHKIVCECDIAISTLSLHKKNMNEASPLKFREYLAYGLPVIIAYEETAFVGKQYPEWILRIPNTETNIDNYYKEIVRFSYDMKNKIISRSEVAQYIDSGIWEKKRLDYFKKILKK